MGKSVLEKGLTYFDWRRGFSINEGQYPNVHLGWFNGLDFYICLWGSVRLWLHVSLRSCYMGIGNLLPQAETKEITLWSPKQ